MPQGAGIYIRDCQMKVSKCSSAATGCGDEQRCHATAPEKVSARADAQPSTALVLRTAPVAGHAPRVNRPAAAFLAHLIATAEQIPQTRVFRRGSITDAMSYYDATATAASTAARTKRRLLSRIA